MKTLSSSPSYLQAPSLPQLSLFLEIIDNTKSPLSSTFIPDQSHGWGKESGKDSLDNRLLREMLKVCGGFFLGIIGNVFNKTEACVFNRPNLNRP